MRLFFIGEMETFSGTEKQYSPMRTTVMMAMDQFDVVHLHHREDSSQRKA
jgi:hypothetical protein